jgi:hypothetical protein
VTVRTWLGAALLFFAWGFVLHAAGLVLHEVGGHGVAGVALGCGVAGIDLTYFGHGVLHYTSPCARWTWATATIADWSGLALTVGAGVFVMVLQRRAGLAPLTRLLLALLGTAFLLGQLSYATSGGFNDLYDPARTARALGARGLHPLAWLPPAALYTVAAFVGARAITEAQRAHFAPASRLRALGQTAATLGVAGALYFVAFRIEWTIRADLWMRGVAFEAQRIAVARNEAPPFPIERVLVAIAAVAFVAAFLRPVRRDGEGRRGTIPRRQVGLVALAALASVVAITLLSRV